MRMGKGIDRYKKTLPGKIRIVQKEQAAQLKRFRQLPGSRAERLRVLKEIRIANGEKATLDLIDAEIRHAMNREKELLRARIEKMRAEGKSVTAICKATKVPASTIYLHLKKVDRPPEDRPARPLGAPRIVSGDKGA